MDNCCSATYIYFRGSPFDIIVVYSDLENGFSGLGNISADPLFITGPKDEYYLSQAAAGQELNSPCLDTGDQPASAVCYPVGTDTVCLDSRSTRTDELPDSGTVDMGYHRPQRSLVTAGFDCVPSSGAVPFITMMTASMTNNQPDFSRRFAGRIDVTLAGGSSIANWRAGYTNLAACTVTAAAP
jgi:hypothetical protein